MSGKIIGWVAYFKQSKEAVRTNSDPRRTAKCYSSKGQAIGAIKLSEHHRILHKIDFIPVTIPD